MEGRWGGFGVVRHGGWRWVHGEPRAHGRAPLRDERAGTQACPYRRGTTRRPARRGAPGCGATLGRAAHGRRCRRPPVKGGEVVFEALFGLGEVLGVDVEAEGGEAEGVGGEGGAAEAGEGGEGEAGGGEGGGRGG